MQEVEINNIKTETKNMENEEYYDMSDYNDNKYDNIENEFKDDNGEFDKLLWSHVNIHFINKMKKIIEESE